MTDLPPPDWYTDPSDPAQYRYWDGSQWTDHRAPRHSSPSGHQSLRDLLAGTWRLATQNWRPLLIIYAVVAVLYLAAEQAVIVGHDDVFGDTLVALIDDLGSADSEPDSEVAQEAIEDRWNDLTDRVESLDSSTLAAGVLLMVVGVIAAIAVNIVEFAAFGQFTMARLGGRPMGAASALRAGLGRLLRVAGVGLMLLAMLCAACMVASLAAGLLSLASGALAAVLLSVAVLVMVVGAAPLVLLALMTAAVGPSTPSLRYARSLVEGTYWATLRRVAMLFVLSTTATVVVVLVAELLGLVGDPVTRLTLVLLGVFPEVLSSIAFFTMYRDLGGEHGDAVASPGSELPAS